MSFNDGEDLRIDRDPLKHIDILCINAKLIFRRIQFTTIDCCKLRLIKRNLQQSIVVNWMRRKINFALIHSMSMCLRGSRSIRKSSPSLNDIEIDDSIQRV